MELSGKAVERLSRYRRELLRYQYLEEPHIFSSDLARILNLSPEQIRQDLMLTDFKSGSKKKGYDINKLLIAIEKTIDPQEQSNIAFVGKGSLVNVLKNFVETGSSKLEICAIFSFASNEPTVYGIPCYSMGELSAKIKEYNIEIVVLAISPEFATEIADALIINGIKGILNLSSVHLGNPPGIFIEDFDIISSIEKIAYFVKKREYTK